MTQARIARSVRGQGGADGKAARGSPLRGRGLQAQIVLAAVVINSYHAVFLVGRQAPMYTFQRVHQLATRFYKAGKITAVVCHATCILLKTRLSSGELLVVGKG